MPEPRPTAATLQGLLEHLIARQNELLTYLRHCDSCDEHPRLFARWRHARAEYHKALREAFQAKPS